MESQPGHILEYGRNVPWAFWNGRRSPSYCSSEHVPYSCVSEDCRGGRRSVREENRQSTICVRLMGMFGHFDGAQLGLPARLVHAAVSGRPPSFQDVFFGNADDAVDLLYIKDMARAIALVETAEKLQYDVYNIASSKVTPNRELVDAVNGVVPNFRVDLPPGHFPFPPLPLPDTKRLQADTGFSPKFDTASAVQHYVDWLKAGNPK